MGGDDDEAEVEQQKGMRTVVDNDNNLNRVILDNRIVADLLLLLPLLFVHERCPL